MSFRSATHSLTVPRGDTVTVLPEEARAWAVQAGQLTELVQTMYSIVLYDTSTNEIYKSESPPLDPAGRTYNAEFYFRVPPKVHEMDEQFATNVVATQDGGKYVESYGSVFKHIRLSGTTGLRPNKVVRGEGIPASVNETLSGFNLAPPGAAQLDVLSGTGLSIQRRKIPSSEITGHDDIIFLRNIFRKYSDLKQSDQIAGRVVMLWRNIKDADYWVVEPEDFKLSQSASSPMTYEYNISLKILTKFSFEFVRGRDALEERLSMSRFYSRLQEYNQNILNIFLSLSTQIDRVRGLATAVSNLVLGPLVNVAVGLSAVRTSITGVERSVKQRAKECEQGILESLALVESIFSSTPQEPLINTLRKALRLIIRIQIEPGFNDGAVSETGSIINRYAEAYVRPGTATTPRRTPVDSTYIGSERAPSGAETTVVRGGEDIRDIAARVLGDRARWRILVAMNRLRYPFISTVPAPGVLVPGDSILYPSVSSRPGVLVSSGVTPEARTTPLQDSYGRDLRLKRVRVGDTILDDLDINQRGDIAQISGIDNVFQALEVKFNTQRGELPAHKDFGAKFPTGRKSTAVSFNDIRLTALATLKSDNRVDSVKSLRFTSSGDVLNVVADVVLVKSQDTINSTFSLRRF